MKLTKTTRERLKPLLNTLIDDLGKAWLISLYKGNQTGTAFDLWHCLYCSIVYDVKNPNVVKKDGKRLFEQDINFLMYPDQTNDDTLKTGLIFMLDSLLN